jgi:hypothetical protein
MKVVEPGEVVPRIAWAERRARWYYVAYSVRYRAVRWGANENADASGGGDDSWDIPLCM